jgi:hypothetical protein
MLMSKKYLCGKASKKTIAQRTNHGSQWDRLLA